MYNRGRIILLGYECAAVWDMPELQSARPDIASMEPIAPDFQVIFGLPEELIPSRAISLQGMDTHRWDQYVDHGLPLLLDTISDKTGSLQIMLNDAYNYPVPNATSFYSHTFRDSSESVLKRWRVKQRYCKDTIVRTWYSLLSGTFYLSLLPSPGSDGAASQPLDTHPQSLLPRPYDPSVHGARAGRTTALILRLGGFAPWGRMAKSRLSTTWSTRQKRQVPA